MQSRFGLELRRRAGTFVKQHAPKILLPYIKRGSSRLFEFSSGLFPSVRYRKRLEQEIVGYSACASVHDLPQIAHYWSHKFLIPMLQPFGFCDSVELFRTYIARLCSTDRTKRRLCLSLGCGDSQSEIRIVQWLREQGYSNFHFHCYDVNPLFIGFGNLIDIFIDRAFGPNFDPTSNEDTAFIDRVHALGMSLLESGTLKPTHILAALTNVPVKETTIYKNLTPAFCVRWPDV